MDPLDPLRGRARHAILAALLVPVLLVGLLAPSRSAPAQSAEAAQAGVAAERATEPPTGLEAPPASRMRFAASRVPRVVDAPHRSKFEAFEAAQTAARSAQPAVARLRLVLSDSSHDATVELANERGERSLHPAANGELAIDLAPGVYTLIAWTPAATGGPLELRLEPRETHRAELALVPAATVEGRVVDVDSGAPIAGASVAFWTHSELDRVLTGADGRFVHPRFPAQAPSQQVRIAAPGYAPSVRYVELLSAGAWIHRAAFDGDGEQRGDALPARIDVALARELVLEGRVLDADRTPIEGARVEALGYARLLPDVATRDEAAGVTDSRGRFRLAGLRRDVSHALRVRAAGRAELVRELPALRPETAATTPTRFEDGAVDVGDLVLDDAALVSGVLLDASGEPLVDAEVRLERLDVPAAVPTTPADPGARPSLASRVVRTDAIGAFLFDELAAGEYELRARRDRGAIAVLALDVHRAEQRGDVRLEASSPTWTLRGVARSPAGPLAFTAVEVERFGPVARVVTDAEGRFALAGLDDVATYTVRAVTAGPSRAEVTAFAWEPVTLHVADVAAVARR